MRTNVPLQKVPEGGGGGVGTCEIRIGEIWCRENLEPILKSHRKIWNRFSNPNGKFGP